MTPHISAAGSVNTRRESSAWMGCSGVEANPRRSRSLQEFPDPKGLPGFLLSRVEPASPPLAARVERALAWNSAP